MFKRNLKALRYFVFVALLTFGYYMDLLTPRASWGGTALGDLAASMQPGTWSQLTGTNAGLLSSQWTSGGHGYDDGNMAWNSKKRILMHTSADHGPYVNCSSFPNPPGTCWKALSFYNDSTNTWSLGGAIPPQINNFHGWDQLTWDDVNEVLYIANYGPYPNIHRYCVNNTPSWCSGKQGVWSPLASQPVYFGNIPSMTYHAALNGGTLILNATGANGGNCSRILGYREATGTWTDIDAGAGCKFDTGPYSSVSEYSEVKQVAIVGGGGSKRLWKIDAAGTVTELTPAPLPINFGATDTRQVLADPVSGDFIFFFGQSNNGGVSTTLAQLWKLNPNGSGTWTQLDSDLRASGKPCNTDFIIPCPNDFFGTTISTYGVLLFWKWTSTSTADVWLYKPSGGSSVPLATNVDTTSPTVSITAPIAGNTVSGNPVSVSATAADNVGVVGVQFKLDGNNLGAEATSSPFSVSWNTTPIANGSHTLTAIARDAAGNSVVSTPVTITVSNAAGGTTSNAGGSDFASRCAAPGVVKCVSFDAGSEIACSTWGCTSGVDLVGITAAPVIDTAVKASGAGSLKFTITSQSGANGAGAYWTNFSNDLLTQFGAGQAFYVQWRQRFSPELINTIFQKTGGGSAGGWKQISLTTGDIATTPCPTVDSNEGWCQVQVNENKQQVSAYSSCTPIDVPVQNTNQRKLPQMYNACSPNASHAAPYWGIETYPSGDISFQNARPSPFCLYTQGGQPNGGFFPPNGNCFPYFPNEWMTFKVKLTLGPRGAPPAPCNNPTCGSVAGQAPNNVWGNSRIQLWVGREGQPTEMAIDQLFDVGAGNSGAQKFGKIYLLPYHSYKDPSQVHPTAFTWYDELIISTQDIADPGGVVPPPPVAQPPAAPTGLTLK
jgi:hypothetical protein